MNDFLETFHIDWMLMLAQVINFGLVFLALYILAAKPLRKLIEERTKEINTGLEDAKTNAQVLKKTKQEYEDVLVKARVEANSIFETAKKEAEEKKIAMLEDAKKEVNSMIENGKKSLQTEKIKMVEDAKKEIIDLVVKATEKVIGEKIDNSYEQTIKKELSTL